MGANLRRGTSVLALVCVAIMISLSVAQQQPAPVAVNNGTCPAMTGRVSPVGGAGSTARTIGTILNMTCPTNYTRIGPWSSVCTNKAKWYPAPARCGLISCPMGAYRYPPNCNYDAGNCTFSIMWIYEQSNLTIYLDVMIGANTWTGFGLNNATELTTSKWVFVALLQGNPEVSPGASSATGITSRSWAEFSELYNNRQTVVYDFGASTVAGSTDILTDGRCVTLIIPIAGTFTSQPAIPMNISTVRMERVCLTPCGSPTPAPVPVGPTAAPAGATTAAGAATTAGAATAAGGTTTTAKTGNISIVATTTPVKKSAPAGTRGNGVSLLFCSLCGVFFNLVQGRSRLD